MRLGAVVLLVGVAVVAGCGGRGADDPPSGCSSVDVAFAEASVATADIGFISATTPDELYAATQDFIQEINSDDDRCLTRHDRDKAFASVRSQIGADCQACRDELDRAEG